MTAVLEPTALTEWATHYAQAGLEVFPVNPRDKTPYVSQHQATTDPDIIADWWDHWPTALIGHRISPRHVLLDIDPRHGGLDTWQALHEAIGQLPPTRGHLSGRGDHGGHIWWIRPADRLTIRPLNAWAQERGHGHELPNGKWSAGIDILHRDHRYTILPPSPHPDTHKPYQWIPGHGLDIPPGVLPQLLVDLITDDTPPAPKPPPGPIDPASIADWYSSAFSWPALLGHHGWTIVGGDGHSDGSRWRHPSATNSFSATIRHGCLFVYSPNTPFDVTEQSDPHGYTLFRAYAQLDHHGDLTAAGRAARTLKDGPTAPRDDLSWVGAPTTNGNGQQPTQDEAEAELHLEPVHPFIIWDDFWAEDTTDEEWLIDQVFAKGRGHALYAQAKQGKSLFVLERSARLAVTNPDCDVVYLDYEMTRSDVRDRLTDMGYGPGDDLTRLHYALLPALPPLDTLEGANALLELCTSVHRPSCDLFVVIDTTGRAVIGEENSNDTIRGFYRWTGSALKRNEVTWVRLDHAGKDVTKGQRGGSAKNDDVDIVWKLSAGDAGAITLHREAARMSWVPDHITFSRSDAPLRYETGPEMWPAGTKDLAGELDQLGLPTDIGRNKARAAINEAGISASNEVLGAACRWRASKARSDLSWAVDNPS